MLMVKNKKTISIKDIYKKINWLLVKNFFSIDEFLELSLRQQYKALKIIAKIESLNIVKHELKDIIKIINGNFVGNVETIKLLLPSLKATVLFKKVVERIEDTFATSIFVITFRNDRFELMLN